MQYNISRQDQLILYSGQCPEHTVLLGILKYGFISFKIRRGGKRRTLRPREMF